MKYFRKKSTMRSPGGESNLDGESLTAGERSVPASPDDLSVSLRAEMLPASKLSPDVEVARFKKVNPFRIWAILALIVLLALGWLLYAGPGRPVLENLLSSLVRPTETSVPKTPTAYAVTEIAVAPTSTFRVVNTPTHTPIPPSTATVAVILDTPTSQPSPTPGSSCSDVLTVTLAEVGKTLCVRGVIKNFEARPSGFLIAFSNQPGAMYWVSYDLVWEPAKEGLCVEITGEVMQIANSPVIVFGYQNLPEICANP